MNPKYTALLRIPPWNPYLKGENCRRSNLITLVRYPIIALCDHGGGFNGLTIPKGNHKVPASHRIAVPMTGRTTGLYHTQSYK